MRTYYVSPRKRDRLSPLSTRDGLFLLRRLAASWVLVVLSTLLAYGVGVLIMQQGGALALGLTLGLVAGGVLLFGLPILLAVLVHTQRTVVGAKDQTTRHHEDTQDLADDVARLARQQADTTTKVDHLIEQLNGSAHEERRAESRSAQSSTPLR